MYSNKRVGIHQKALVECFGSWNLVFENFCMALSMEETKQRSSRPFYVYIWK